MEQDKSVQSSESETKQKKIKDKRKRKWIVAIGIVVSLVIVVLIVYKNKFMHSEESSHDWTLPDFNRSDHITATGTTIVGVTSTEFEIDFLEDTDLYVEKVYLHSGDEVQAGAEYLKITDSSISDARKELEDAELNASISYRTSVISTKESEIKAEYAYKQAILAGEQAQAVYNDQMAMLTQKVEETKEAYEAAQEELAELQENLSGGYIEKYDVEAKKKAYEDNQQLYHDILAYYDMTEDDLESTGAQEASSTGTTNKDKQIDSDLKWQKSAIKLVKEEYEESEEEYEKAKKDLDNALLHYEYDLKKAQNKIDIAKQEYDEAKLALEKESLSAKTTLETTLAKAKMAKADYETEKKSLEEALETLADEKTEAGKNLALFEELIGDGYLRTAGAGTVLKIMAKEGDILEGGKVLIAYQDISRMSVSVSVSQDDISQLSVGENACISIDEYGEFNGKITSINPVSSSESKTSVSYTVEVALEGDINELSQNLTANVTFDMTKEEMEQKQSKHASKDVDFDMNKMDFKEAGGRKNEKESNE